MATDDQVWAVAMMRDEADVAFSVLEHLADEGVDGIVVADNLSTDGTRAELDRASEALPCQVVVFDDSTVGYFQSDKMTYLARIAADLGAAWIVPFDADELWLAHSDRLAVALRALPDEVTVAHAELFNHFATALDLDDPLAFRSMIYRQADPGALPKVAFRWHPDAVIHQGNHGVTLPEVVVSGGDIEIRHFPYRSFEHFARKARNGAAAYAATDLPASEGAHWRQYGELLERHGEGALREVWDRWFWFLLPSLGGLVLDPAPFCRWV